MLSRPSRQIVSCAAPYLVVSGGAVDEVVAVAARQAVVAVATDHGIVAEGAVEDIVATVAPERIVPGAGLNPVRPVGAADHDVIVAKKL